MPANIAKIWLAEDLDFGGVDVEEGAVVECDAEECAAGEVPEEGVGADVGDCHGVLRVGVGAEYSEGPGLGDCGDEEQES